MATTTGAAGFSALRAADDADSPDSADGVGASMLAEEEQLRGASAARLAVLRACPLFSEAGTAAAECESLLGDAIGLQELLGEYLDDLEGLAIGAPSRAAASRTPLSALLPPATTTIQLTHSADLAGATVYAILGQLDGAFHVCAAPLALQELFDAISQRKSWERVLLPGKPREDIDAPQGPAGGTVASPGPATAHFATTKLERAGYQLMRPFLVEGSTQSRTDDERGVVRRTADAGRGDAATGAGGGSTGVERGDAEGDSDGSPTDT